jgi:hypothetical protein
MRQHFKAVGFEVDLPALVADICDFYVLARFEFEVVGALDVWIEEGVRGQEAPVGFFGLVEGQVLEVTLRWISVWLCFDALFRGLGDYSMAACISGIMGQTQGIEVLSERLLTCEANQIAGCQPCLCRHPAQPQCEPARQDPQVPAHSI